MSRTTVTLTQEASDDIRMHSASAVPGQRFLYLNLGDLSLIFRGHNSLAVVEARKVAAIILAGADELEAVCQQEAGTGVVVGPVGVPDAPR